MLATSVKSQTTDRYENDKNDITDKKTKYFEKYYKEHILMKIIFCNRKFRL
jgi:hypothetical protein